MDRRTFVQAAMVSALPSAAFGQGAPAGISPEQKHAAETLEASATSLEASHAAATKAVDANVRRFAQFEAAEQDVVASVVKAATGMSETAPAPLSAEAKAMVEILKAMPSGPEFDKAYVKGQVEGHQRLLQIQEVYLTNGKNQTHRSIAMLIRGHVKEHLAQLELMHKLPA
jgi:putative membrane protein